jgi:hypothetical protein
MAQKAKVTGSKKGPPDTKHWEHFNEALQNALDKADPAWGDGTTEVTIQFEATVKTKSPGNIHEYRITLKPPGT